MAREWVFGKKQDLMVFSGPIILTLCLIVFTRGLNIEWGPFFLLSHLLFNLPHIYISYWHAYGYQGTRKDHLLWLVFIPSFFVVLNATMYYTFGREILSIGIAHFTAWHFLKQQQAWFMISSGKTSGVMKFISKNGIYAVTIGIFLASLCEGHYKPWYRGGDLVELPAWAFQPLIMWVCASAVMYVIAQFVSWKKTGKTNWAAHHTFLAAGAIWWITRLVRGEPTVGFLIPLAHAVPYLFLSYRYIRTKHTGSDLKVGLIFVLVYLGTLGAGYLDVFSRDSIPEGERFFDPIFITLGAFSFSHIALDMILWNRKHNPGWVQALAPSTHVETRSEQEPPVIAA